MPRAGEDVSEWTLDEEIPIPSPVVLFRNEGFKWNHLGENIYMFKEDGTFRGGKHRGHWTIEELTDNQKSLKIRFGAKKHKPSRATVYFSWPLQVGLNFSILEHQTGPGRDKHVKLLC